MIPNASGDTVILIIKSKVVPDSIVYSDGWKGYNAVDVTDFHHIRINHSTEFVDGDNHINGIENFWNSLIDDTCYGVAIGGVRSNVHYPIKREFGNKTMVFISRILCYI